MVGADWVRLRPGWVHRGRCVGSAGALVGSFDFEHCLFSLSSVGSLALFDSGIFTRFAVGRMRCACGGGKSLRAE